MSPLRAKRLEAGLTLTELAKRAHMTHDKLSRLERGIYKLTVDDVLRLASELGCEASEIMPPVPRKVPTAS